MTINNTKYNNMGALIKSVPLTASISKLQTLTVFKYAFRGII